MPDLPPSVVYRGWVVWAMPDPAGGWSARWSCPVFGVGGRLCRPSATPEAAFAAAERFIDGQCGREAGRAVEMLRRRRVIGRGMKC